MFHGNTYILSLQDLYFYGVACKSEETLRVKLTKKKGEKVTSPKIRVSQGDAVCYHRRFLKTIIRLLTHQPEIYVV